MVSACCTPVLLQSSSHAGLLRAYEINEKRTGLLTLREYVYCLVLFTSKGGLALRLLRTTSLEDGPARATSRERGPHECTIPGLRGHLIYRDSTNDANDSLSVITFKLYSLAGKQTMVNALNSARS